MMTNYVIKENDRVYVKPLISKKKPDNCVGVLPEGIAPEDYPYLQAVPVYSEDYPEMVVGHDISVDQAAKDADAPNIQAEKDTEAMRELRQKRDLLLSETDFTQLADAPITEQQKTDYATYRQALRDLPDNTVDVHNPVFPTKPGS